MSESIAAAALQAVAAYIGIDWADQKHDVVLRSASQPNKVEHRIIEHKLEALMEWVGELQQLFAGQGKILGLLRTESGCAHLSFNGLRILRTLPS